MPVKLITKENAASHPRSEMTPAPESTATLLALRGIRKRFGGVVALDGVDFDLRAGEIHALLGENGAGKSTLINILGGIHRPDEGEIRVDGEAVQIGSVTDADRLGIRLIHQELALAPNLSIADNLFLGREPTRFGLLDRRRLVADAERLRDELGLPELGDVRVRVGELNVARRQLVEIARALAVRVRILVLDEPTASLSESETEALFGKLRRLRGQGVGIIYISHRLEEISRLADRITVLRDGRSIGTQRAADLDMRQLITWMVGRELKEHYPRPPHTPGEVALSVRGLRAPGVNDVSFELRCGEVLGLAGLVGAGRTELARVLGGLVPATGGEIAIGGRPVRLAQPCGRAGRGNRPGAGGSQTRRPGDDADGRLQPRAAVDAPVGARLHARPPAARRHRRAGGEGFRHQGQQRRRGDRHALGRQPAEGRRRQMDGAAAEDPDPRRTDARRGRGGAGGDIRAHRPARRPAHGRAADLVRPAGSHEPFASPRPLSRRPHRAPGAGGRLHTRAGDGRTHPRGSRTVRPAKRVLKGTRTS